MNYQDMDAQAKWEATALNALEQASTGIYSLALAIQTAVNNGETINPEQILKILRETQIRLHRDLREMRRLTDQREREQP